MGSVMVAWPGSVASLECSRGRRMCTAVLMAHAAAVVQSTFACLQLSLNSPHAVALACHVLFVKLRTLRVEIESPYVPAKDRLLDLPAGCAETGS